MGSLVIVITGAGSGIGLHMARALLEQGHRVAVLDVAPDGLQELVAAFGDRISVYRADITLQADVNAAIADVIARWRRIDVLVNNACRCTFAPFEEREIDRIQAEIDVNLLGHMRVIKAVLPHMKERGRGVIHNVSSGVGLTGFPGLTAYTAAKGALEAFSRSLALELAPYGISVHVMHPPLTDTPSASPLGVPARFMADPAVVGRRLAARILSRRTVITPGFGAGLGLLMSRWVPGAVGRMLAGATERARRRPEPKRTANR